MAENQLHLVALPVPLQGHINPILNWLRRLGTSSGVFSTLLVPENDVSRLNLKEPFVRAMGIPSNILDLNQCKNLNGMHQFLSILELMEGAKDGFVELLSKNNAWNMPVKCLVVDQFIHMGQDVANELNIPRISFWSSSAAAICVSSSIPRFLSEGVLPSTEMDELPIDFVPGIMNLRRKNLPHSLFVPESLLNWRKKVMSRNREAACMVGNTIYELESQVIDAIKQAIGTKFVAIGPLFDVDKEVIASSPSGAATILWEEDMHCLGWLDKQVPSSVLYISFGSMAQLSALQVEQIALGLEASKQAFLWVMRPNLVQGLNPEVLTGFLERTGDQGLVISWAPQLKVLGHKSVGGFLTHCGWNSTMEAVCCGVPMLGWPCFAEQNLNCKFIVDDWEIGLRFNKGLDGLVAAAEVERVVRLLMVDNLGNIMRSRCQELSERVTKDAGKGNVNFQQFVNE